MLELYRKHRPRKLSQLVGQPEVVEMLLSFIREGEIPHVILFFGPSGSGKTTTARILARKVGCRGTDLVELNVADFRGVDTIRKIRSCIGQMPLMGKSRVWILDESGELGGTAQQALLKILEETPSHVYFMLATTDPQKLIKTVRNRCTEIQLKPLSPDNMEILLRRICRVESTKISSEVRHKIVEVAEGSARKALVILNQALKLKTKSQQLECIESSESQRQTIELCRKLMQPNPQWREIAPIIKNIEDDPEKVRRSVLGYAASVLLNGGIHPKALQIIEVFSGNYYDVGKAGLIWSASQLCYRPNKRR
jgi:DNA polymerase III gamma/tau subunit